MDLILLQHINDSKINKARYIRNVLCEYFNIDQQSPQFQINNTPNIDIDKLLHKKLIYESEQRDESQTRIINEVLYKHFNIPIPPTTKKQKKKAYRDMIKIEKCAQCGYDEKPSSLHVHHKDYNHNNNDVSNLVVLCGNCHHQLHFENSVGKGNILYRKPNERLVKLSPKNKATMQKTVTVEKCIKCNYDIPQLLEICHIGEQYIVLCQNCYQSLMLDLWDVKEYITLREYKDSDFLALIKATPISNLQITRAIGCNGATTKRRLRMLESQNKIKRIGESYWVDINTDITCEQPKNMSQKYISTDFIQLLDKPMSTVDISRELKCARDTAQTWLNKLFTQNLIRKVYETQNNKQIQYWINNEHMLISP